MAAQSMRMNTVTAVFASGWSHNLVQSSTEEISGGNKLDGQLDQDVRDPGEVHAVAGPLAAGGEEGQEGQRGSCLGPHLAHVQQGRNPVLRPNCAMVPQVPVPELDAADCAVVQLP